MILKKTLFFFAYICIINSQKQCSRLRDFSGNIYNPSSLIQSSFNNLNINLDIDSVTNISLIFQKIYNSIYYYVFKMKNNKKDYFIFIEFNQKNNKIENFLITTELNYIEKFFKIRINEFNLIRCDNMKCIFSQKCKNESNCQNCPNCTGCSRKIFSSQTCEYIENIGNPVKLIELMMISWYEWFNPEKNLDINIIFEKKNNEKIFFVYKIDTKNGAEFMVVDYNFRNNQIGELFVTFNFNKINEVFKLNLNLTDGNNFFCPKLKCSFFDTCGINVNDNKIGNLVRIQGSIVNKLDFAKRIKEKKPFQNNKKNKYEIENLKNNFNTQNKNNNNFKLTNQNTNTNKIDKNFNNFNSQNKKKDDKLYDYLNNNNNKDKFIDEQSFERQRMQFQGNYGQGNNKKKIDNKLANNLLIDQLEKLEESKRPSNDRKRETSSKRYGSGKNKFDNEIFFNEKNTYTEKNSDKTVIIRNNNDENGKPQTYVYTADSDSPDFKVKKFNEKFTIKYKPFQDMMKNFTNFEGRNNNNFGASNGNFGNFGNFDSGN